MESRAVDILTLHGRVGTYVVPTWATYAARDENGKLWAFEKEPVQSPASQDYNLGFWHLSAHGGNCAMIEEPVKGRNSVCKHWRTTLIKL